ncbi:cerebellin 18 [Cottoperca gobio]|uniref:Cerebellin 18 n=1 Tax=Cottoperca gobio TaxID=56716 RepID=A0A6J2QUP2_COTGO|nr:complement C1q tumor necrosis factor-related protein 3-like [Cottoperca gobio]
MFRLEDDIYKRLEYLWHDIITLKYRVHMFTESLQVAFKASNIIVTTTGPCFGPFNVDMPIPYSSVTLNDNNGYQPSLGIFTAPYAGVYVFSFTVYSQVQENEQLYHKVQLSKNGQAIAGIWESNRNDQDDNGNQVMVVELQRGDQVYTELMSGRKLCKHLQYNVFTGYMLYPHPYPYTDEYDE